MASAAAAGAVLVGGTVIAGSLIGSGIDGLLNDPNIQFSKQSGGGGATVNQNDLNHIFGKAEHNLDDFLESYKGDQNSAYNAVQKAGQAYVNKNNVTGLVKDVVVNVNGFDVTIRGMVVDGIFKIGTFFK